MSEPWLMCRATLRRYLKIWRTSHNLDRIPTSLSFDIFIISYNTPFPNTCPVKLSTLFMDTHRTVFYSEMRQPRGRRVKNVSTPNHFRTFLAESGLKEPD